MGRRGLWPRPKQDQEQSRLETPPTFFLLALPLLGRVGRGEFKSIFFCYYKKIKNDSSCSHAPTWEQDVITAFWGAGFNLHSLVQEQAKETVKVLAFSSPLWKRGVGGDFIIKIRPLISMCCIFIKSPSIPLFQRGRSKTEYFHSL